MKPPFSAGVLLLSVAGVFAYAITAITSEANFRLGTVVKTPVDAIAKTSAAIRTEDHLLEKIERRLVPVDSRLILRRGPEAEGPAKQE